MLKMSRSSSRFVFHKKPICRDLTCIQLKVRDVSKFNLVLHQTVDTIRSNAALIEVGRLPSNQETHIKLAVSPFFVEIYRRCCAVLGRLVAECKDVNDTLAYRIMIVFVDRHKT